MGRYMTRHRYGAAPLVLASLSLSLVPGVRSAAQTTRISTDVSAGVAVGTNPYLQGGDNTSGVSAFFEVAPMLTYEDEVSSLTLRGRARIQPYLERYSADDALSLDLNVTRKLSDRLSVRGAAGFQTNRSSAQDILLDRQISLTPVIGLNPLLSDISFIGQRTRTTSLNAQVGATWRPSEIEQGDVDVGTGVQRFGRRDLADYRYANQQFRYSRSISERTSLTAAVGFSEVDYLGRRAGDAFIVSPRIGIEQQIQQSWRLSASAGLSQTRIRRIDDRYSTRNTIALQGSLCQDRARGRLCFNADRSSQPTALGDVRSVTTVGAAFTQRLSDRDELLVNANYSRTSEPRLGGRGGGAASFAGASAEFTRKLNDRFSWFAGASFADIYQTNNPRRANYQARAGIRYRFGDVR